MAAQNMLWLIEMIANRLLKSFKIFLFAKERRNPKVANIAFNHK
jgi:hypothetical protein